MTDKDQTTMRIAICDDEETIRKDLKERVEDILPEAEVSVFSSGEALLSDGSFFDVILLDVEMDGQNGLQIASMIRRRQEETGSGKSVMIFITGYEQYMPDAFDVQAFHYLLKPVHDDKLREVLLRAKKEISGLAKQERHYVLLKAAGTSQKVFLDEMLYLESSNKKVIVHLAGGAVMETYRKMEEMEKLLGNGFYRTHRCYLVNMQHIRTYNATELTVTNGDRVLIAQRKYNAFVKTYLRHLRSHT